MATIYVGLVEEDLAFELVDLTYIVTHPERKEDEGDGEGQQLVEQGKTKQLLLRALKSAPAVLGAADSDVEAFCGLIAQLTSRLEGKDAKEVYSALVAALSAEPEVRAVIKVKQLASLFGFIPASNTAQRYQVLVALLETAVKGRQARLLSGRLEQVEKWVSSWKLSADQARTLLTLVANVYRALPNSQKKLHDTLVKILATYNDGKDLAQSSGLAVEAIVSAIETPEVAQCDDLLQLAAVQALGKSKDHAATFELLSIFASQHVAEYLRFHEAQKAHIQAIGVNHERALAKLRVLTMCSLGLKEEKLSYALLQEKLGVKTADELEEVVVEAVASGFIDAKIDESQEVVIIERSTQRQFNSDSWKQLSQQLNSWTDNVAHVLNAFEEARAQFELPQQPQHGKRGGKQRDHNDD